MPPRHHSRQEMKEKFKPGPLNRVIVINLIRCFVAEFLATFMFTGAVYAAIINSSRVADPAASASIMVGMAVGLSGTATVWSFGDISGAHFNPAITFGFIVTGKMPLFKGIGYIISQILGAIASAGFMYLAFPNNVPGQANITDVIPLSVPLDIPPYTALVLETFLTFCLVYVVFATAVDRVLPGTTIRALLPIEESRKKKQKTEEKGLSTAQSEVFAPENIKRNTQLIAVPKGGIINPSGSPADNTSVIGSVNGTSDRPIQVYTNCGPTKRDFAPLSIGLTLGFLAFLGSSVSGGGFNPARALGSAIVTDNYNSQWIYWFGPLAGGSLAGFLQRYVLANEGAVMSALPEKQAVKQIQKLIDEEEK